jgi:hypothetical protein
LELIEFGISDSCLQNRLRQELELRGKGLGSRKCYLGR